MMSEERKENMKERRYPEVSFPSDMASEPAGAAAYADDVLVMDEEPEARTDVDFGFPRTVGEVKKELLQAEAERADPTKWCTSQEFWDEMKKEFPWANVN